MCSRPPSVTGLVSNVNDKEAATHRIIGMFVSYLCLRLNVQCFKKQNVLGCLQVNLKVTDIRVGIETIS